MRSVLLAGLSPRSACSSAVSGFRCGTAPRGGGTPAVAAKVTAPTAGVVGPTLIPTAVAVVVAAATAVVKAIVSVKGSERVSLYFAEIAMELSKPGRTQSFMCDLNQTVIKLHSTRLRRNSKLRISKERPRFGCMSRASCSRRPQKLEHQRTADRSNQYFNCSKMLRTEIRKLDQLLPLQPASKRAVFELIPLFP